MNQIENELFLFEGNIAKIVIESEDSMYCPPAPGQEIRQRLTLNQNGSVALTRWYSGDFSVVPPVTEESKVMRRWRNKPTENVLEIIANYFREYHMQERTPKQILPPLMGSQRYI